MRPVMLVAYLLVAGGVACSGTTSVDGNSLIVGAWMAPSETLHPNGSMTRYLGFSESGTFHSSVDSYGVYPGQSPTTLSAYIRITGSYKVDGDQLIMTSNRIATWDSFYGAGSPETVENVNTTFLDGARFRILGATLILNYITYPADAPVSTTASYNRLGPD